MVSPCVNRRYGRVGMPPQSSDPIDPTAQLWKQEVEQSASPIPKLKCVLVGDGAIGKTSLIISYTTNGYPTEYVPTAFDNYAVVVTIDNRPVRLQICDTAGQDDFDSLRPLCYPSTDVFLVCFSVVSPTSFHNVIEKWCKELQEHFPSAPLILVGTQCDLRNDVKVLIELAHYEDRPVSEEEANQLAKDMNVEYIECSALTQKNLKEVFDLAILSAAKHKGLIDDYAGHALYKNKKSKKLKQNGGNPDQECIMWTPPRTKKNPGKSWKKLCCMV